LKTPNHDILGKNQSGREDIMKYFLTGIWVIFSFVMTAELAADKVYTWTDENGKLHITQEPPPKKAKLKDTMDYQPQPAKADLESARRQEIGAEAERKKQKSDEVRKARVEAEKAKKAAEIARGKAEEATRMAKEYSESNNRNQYMQQAYEYQMEQAIEDAKAAEEQASIAQEKAINAEKKAELAQEQAKQAED
jgi:IgA-specific serine endopeptidase